MTMLNVIPTACGKIAQRVPEDRMNERVQTLTSVWFQAFADEEYRCWKGFE
jgi:hypothetical protein